MKLFLRSLRLCKRSLFIPCGTTAVRVPLTVARNRSIQTLTFGSEKEIVFERSDFPRAKLEKMFSNDTMAVIDWIKEMQIFYLDLMRVMKGPWKGGKALV